MTKKNEDTKSKKGKPVPTAPSKIERWFPIAAWLPKYAWGTNLTPDLIAAISVAALLIPESMGYSSVAGVPVQIGLYAAPLALIGYATVRRIKAAGVCRGRLSGRRLGQRGRRPFRG